MTTWVLMVAIESVVVEFVIVDEPNSEPYATGIKTKIMVPHSTKERTEVRPSQ